VKKFQKDRGLKVDGLIHPEGPTLKTLIAQTGEQATAKPLPATPKPLGPLPKPGIAPDLRREAVRRAANRLLQLQKAGIDPRAQLLQRQLAQAKPDAETPKKPSTPAQAPGTDILDKLREIIDELAKNPDPQGGDIDTEHPQRPLRQQPNSSEADKPKQKDNKDSILDRIRDLWEAQLEDDAKKKIIENLTGEVERMKKAKRPPKQPDRKIRKSRPGGGSGGGGATFRIPRKGYHDPFEFLDGIHNMLK